LAKTAVSVRRLLFGKPLPSWRAAHERLPKVLALPVFASDLMSSVAYATEEILIVLVAAGEAALGNVRPISLAIVILLAIVVTSYRRTIFAYPRGGGSYIVSKDNLGTLPGLAAASAILIDYTLTVAVSIAAGVAAFTSAFQAYAPYRVELSLMAIAMVALANLRGLRESGLLFAGPAYLYIMSFLVMIGFGFGKMAMGTLKAPPREAIDVTSSLTTFLILRAFAGGCSAMTGVEAVADGVAAFRPPESKNAATTLMIMAVVLGSLFGGVSMLAHHLHIVPSETETVVSQVARAVFGAHWFYYVVQGATAAILVLAAQTSFADFPRLSYFMARDRFMPRQFANIGDRLAFSNGIIALWLLASTLIIVFHGDVHSLIPLYAVGVLLAFTLSQTGMAVRTIRLKGPKWRWNAAVSATGAFTTGVAMLVFAVAKFTGGAWIVVALIPTFIGIFLKINQHYRRLADQLRLPPGGRPVRPEMRNTVILLVPGIHKGILPAVDYARSLSPDCRAVYIEVDPEDTPLIEERWESWGAGIPLVVLESPYRSVIQPLLRYLEEVKKDRVRHLVTVVIPEFVPARFWHKILHNQTGLMLKWALLFRKDIIVTNIRYYLEK